MQLTSLSLASPYTASNIFRTVSKRCASYAVSMLIVLMTNGLWSSSNVVTCIAAHLVLQLCRTWLLEDSFLFVTFVDSI